jgi:hypothetical protein
VNTYIVTAAVNLVRTFYVTADSPDRAAELIGAGEEALNGEKVVHDRDREQGYEVVDVDEYAGAVPEFILNARGERVTEDELGPWEQGFTLVGRRRA